MTTAFFVQVRRPGDFLEYRLLVHAVSNERRADRNCLRLNEVSFVGPCASSSLLLHLDASSLEGGEGSLVREWRDQSGHGHHARRRGASAAEGPVPVALPDEAADAAIHADGNEEDDGGSPRQAIDAASSRPVVRFEYSLGAGFLQAAGLSVRSTDSMSAFVVCRTRALGWPVRGSKVRQTPTLSLEIQTL